MMRRITDGDVVGIRINNRTYCAICAKIKGFDNYHDMNKKDICFFNDYFDEIDAYCHDCGQNLVNGVTWPILLESFKDCNYSIARIVSEYIVDVIDSPTSGFNLPADERKIHRQKLRIAKNLANYLADYLLEQQLVRIESWETPSSTENMTFQFGKSNIPITSKDRKCHLTVIK